MALTDIVGEAGRSANATSAERGNGGVLVDQIGQQNASRLYIAQPTAAQVQSGVAFGPQAGLTGTYTGSGGNGLPVIGGAIVRAA